MVSYFKHIVQSCNNTCLLVCVLNYKPCHIPLKYRHLHKTTFQWRHAYLRMAYEYEHILSTSIYNVGFVLDIKRVIFSWLSSGTLTCVSALHFVLLKCVALLWTLPIGNKVTILIIGLSQVVSNCKSRKLSFQESGLKLSCKEYKKLQWRFTFPLSDHKRPPNCVNK